MSAIDQLPEYIKPFYRILLKEYDDLEKEYTKDGRAFSVHASKQAVGFLISFILINSVYCIHAKTYKRY